jgi:hydroxymethylglutaryl-CoA lyase
MSGRVTLFEMAPRDGLQNEKGFVATADKIGLVDRLSACGFAKIEVTSFVSPKWVPQLADGADVLAGIVRHQGTRYSALVPNMQGFDAAIQAGADEVAIFASASEGFSAKNINCSIAESLERFAPVAAAAARNGIPLRGYVSCVTDCPYDGPTPPFKVAEVASALVEMGCYEISLGDTIGKGTPQTVSAMLDVLANAIEPDRLAGHFHDTNGRALENISVSLEYGLRTFDASVGGLGGCPYAPGAKGNVDTVKVAEMLAGLGYQTGLDMEKLRKTAQFARALRSVVHGV